MIKILFVCTGNICRSPTAHGVFETMVAQIGKAEEIFVDSAAIMGYHTGEAPDPRTIKHALKRGYDLTHQRARKVVENDFYEFDYILAMDKTHLEHLLSKRPVDSKAVIKLFLDYSVKYKGQIVPDPYYGEASDFELVLNQVEEASCLLLENLTKG